MKTSVMRIASRIAMAILFVVAAYPQTAAQSGTTCPDGEFLAKYYKNLTTAGRPHVMRCEKRIDMAWGEEGPSEDGASDGKADGHSTNRRVGKNDFSVRWTGQFQFVAGNYTFVATADDGMKVWVDGQLIIDEWRRQGPSEFRATRNLTPGMHRVEVVYFQGAGGAVARLRWQR